MHTIGDTGLSQSNRGHLNRCLETATPTPEYPLEEELTEEKLLLFFKFYAPADESLKYVATSGPAGWATSRARGARGPAGRLDGAVQRPGNPRVGPCAPPEAAGRRKPAWAPVEGGDGRPGERKKKKKSPPRRVRDDEEMRGGSGRGRPEPVTNPWEESGRGRQLNPTTQLPPQKASPISSSLLPKPKHSSNIDNVDISPQEGVARGGCFGCLGGPGVTTSTVRTRPRIISTTVA